jgi:hypothetical protein
MKTKNLHIELREYLCKNNIHYKNDYEKYHKNKNCK